MALQVYETPFNDFNPDNPSHDSHCQIRIRVYLNKNLDKNKDFDKSNDVSVDMDYVKMCHITLEDVKIGSKSALKNKGQNIKDRMNDHTFDIIFFSYNEHLYIEDDDDLATEIDNIYPDESESDEEADAQQEQEVVELRMIFRKLVKEKPEEKEDICMAVIAEPFAVSNENDLQSHDHQNGEFEEKMPLKLKDPITNKIMTKPTMIISSLRVYDNITIQRWLESKRYFDPVTGIPMSLGEWPLLLQYRNDIKYEIDTFLKENPSFKSEVFDEAEEKHTDWESLFKIYDEQMNDKCDKYVEDQSNLQKQSQQLFKPCSLEHKEDDEELGVEYNDAIILQRDIPIVVIVGPSRNGKSTVANGILGVEDAYKTSTKSNVALTKGAWITKYSVKCKDEGRVFQPQNEGVNDENVEKSDEKNQNYDEFYLMDMEGLSVDVTLFTKRLFYACYASANVVVWNDKNVASDEFKNLMNALKQEMKYVATSDRKPSFMYLKRDAGDYDYEPYDTLDEYINKDVSFQWFRDMNIFASLSAYELDRPLRGRNDKKGGLNFHYKPENKALLQPLIQQILNLCTISPRFASNIVVLKQQVKHINESTGLSMTEKFIVDNKILRLFLISPKEDSFRKRDMIYVACEFNWDYEKIKEQFQEELAQIKNSRMVISSLDAQLIEKIEANKNEIYERVKNKVELRHPIDVNLIYEKIKTISPIKIVGGVVMTGLGVISGVVPATMIASVLAPKTTYKMYKTMEYAADVAFSSVYAYSPYTDTTENPRRDITAFTKNNYMRYALGKMDADLGTMQKFIIETVNSLGI
eukprot:872313_1